MKTLETTWDVYVDPDGRERELVRVEGEIGPIETDALLCPRMAATIDVLAFEGSSPDLIVMSIMLGRIEWLDRPKRALEVPASILHGFNAFPSSAIRVRLQSIAPCAKVKIKLDAIPPHSIVDSFPSLRSTVRV